MSIGDENLLETPTYVLAVILAGFQLAALIFTVLISSLKRYLRRRKRLGLMESVAHMQEELTLVGFISLILIAFQQQLTSVCVPASAARGDWALLHHVYDAAGCHCCLAATKDLKSCVAAYNQCGNATAPYCNCGGRDPSCMPAAGAAAGAAAGYGALAGGAAPPYPAPAAAEAAAYAAAHSPLDAGHARRRLSGARRALLAGGGGGAAPALASQCLGPITLYGSCPQGQMPVVSFLALEQVHLLIFTITVVHVVCGVLLYFAGLARIRLQWARWERRDDPHTRSVRLQLDQYYAALATGGSADPSRSAAAAPAAAAAAAAGVVDLERQAAAAEVAAAAVVAALQQEHHNGGGAAAAKSAGQGGAGRGGGARLWAWAAEGAKCLCIGLSPRPVTSEQYYKMKASFVVTHRLGAKFEFLSFVQGSLEDDLSHVVGLSFEFWVVIVAFLLVAGPAGFAVGYLMAGTAALLVVVNAKLAQIIRSVTTRGEAGQLSSNVFWLNRPPILLIPIKLALFLCAFIYAWFLFAAWQFSPGSCAFTDAFYPAYVLPWWTIPIFNSLMLLHTSAVTLPAYSLAVQMGSDYKQHMLPKRMQKKLLAVAASIKRKVKSQQDLQQSLSPSASGGDLGAAAVPGAAAAAAAPHGSQPNPRSLKWLGSLAVKRLVGHHEHDHGRDDQ